MGSWNVLHFVHGINYDEHPVGTMPERERIDGICGLVGDLLRDVKVLCLQEVSGDLLVQLKLAFAPRFHIIDKRSGRAPSVRKRTSSHFGARGEHSEHLVIMVNRDMDIDFVRSGTFASDAGKGFLKVAIAGGPQVVCTHLPFDKSHRADQLAQMGLDGSAFTIVCGDMNSTELHVPGLTRVPFAPDGLVSRPKSRSNIDLVLTNGDADGPCEIVDGSRFSDHNPVIVRIAPPTSSFETFSWS